MRATANMDKESVSWLVYLTDSVTHFSYLVSKEAHFVTGDIVRCSGR